MPHDPQGDEETRAASTPVPTPRETGGASSPLSPPQRHARPAATLTPGPATPRDDGEAPAPLSTGRQWAHLTVLDEIGRGGFGRVYRAWDPLLAREVALKIMKVADADPESAARLLREGRMLARVRHANVVTVHGAQQVGDEVGLWMELVRGRSLAHVVAQDGPMSAGEAAVTGASLCRALAAVHAEHLVHRDVKAQNVMREGGGRIVLMDFGTGREIARGGAGDTMGTPLYMAPELLSGEPASPVSDIYSIGVLLYHLVTGRYPYDGHSMADMIVGHSVGRRELLIDRRPDLPDSFVRVVERALSAAPADRYQSAGAMLRDLVQATAASDSGTAAALRAPALVGAESGVLREDALTREPRRASRTRSSAVAWTAGVTGALLAITGLGSLTTLAFNTTLGRPSAFAPETLVDAFVWGVRSLVAPVASAVVVSAPVAMTQVAWRLATTVSGRANTWWVRVRVHLASARARWLPPHVAPQVLALVQAVAIALACWAFFPLVDAFTSFVDVAPARVLEALGPDYLGMRLAFRFVLSVIVFVSIVAWASVWRARPSDVVHGSRVPLAVGVALTVAALAILTAPYRLFNHNQFERVDFAGQRCYDLGQRGSQVLLHCPDLAPPRNRVVAADDPQLRRTAVFESLFTGGARTAIR